MKVVKFFIDFEPFSYCDGKFNERTFKNNILKEDDKTKLMCLSGVKQYPMRVKCATLSWHTLVSAMENDGKEITTEK